MDIHGIEGMSWEDLGRELDRGGRFVTFPYCISVVILTFRRSSGLYFLKKGDSALEAASSYLALSLLLGWWGLPWGPIYTIGSILTILSGGKDVTEEVVQALPHLAPYRAGRGGEGPDTVYLSDEELSETVEHLGLLASEVHSIRESARLYYESRDYTDLENVLADIEGSREWVSSTSHPRGADRAVRLYLDVLDTMLVGLEASAERDRHTMQEAAAAGRAGLDALEDCYARYCEALEARQTRAPRADEPLAHNPATTVGSKETPWWVYASIAGVIVVAALCVWSSTIPRPPQPTPTRSNPTSAATRSTSSQPTPARSNPAARLCDSALSGCISVPRSWDCSTGDGSVLCWMSNDSSLEIFVRPDLTIMSTAGAESYAKDLSAYSDEYWRVTSEVRHVLIYSEQRLCNWFTTTIEEAPKWQTLDAEHYVCAMPNGGAALTWVISPPKASKPTRQEVMAILESWTAAQPQGHGGILPSPEIRESHGTYNRTDACILLRNDLGEDLVLQLAGQDGSPGGSVSVAAKHYRYYCVEPGRYEYQLSASPSARVWRGQLELEARAYSWLLDEAGD